MGKPMLRLTAIFIAVCVVLIAASLGAVVYLLIGLSVAEAAIVALAALATLTIYNTVSSRVRDRSDVGDQIADLSRGTADLARQVGELGRKVAAFEADAGNLERRVKVVVDPVRSEIGDIGTLIKGLAETIAAHESRIAALAANALAPVSAPAPAVAPQPIETPAPAVATIAAPDEAPAPAEAKADPAVQTEQSGVFKGKTSEEIVAIIREAVDANRIDLYLQPILTLPQRKVRYYESMTRLRMPDGTLILPADFLKHAEAAGLMPQIDNLMLFRCV
jgi:cyclic-di-GMP phosphodiesterase TipF (flagellum assembly factor)